MCLLGKNGTDVDGRLVVYLAFLTIARTAEQSEGGKTVGVDSTVITARQ